MLHLKEILRFLKIRASCVPWEFLELMGGTDRKAQIQYVVEKAKWAIHWEGQGIQNSLEKLYPGIMDITSRPNRIIGAEKVVHFGSQYMWANWARHLTPKNHYVASFFHGKPEDSPETARHIDQFLDLSPRLFKIVVSCTIVYDRLRRLGIEAGKLEKIPIGVDTEVFCPTTTERRLKFRRELGVSDDTVVIGSFQKDGQGWRSGNMPKHIKGPDVFLSVAAKLAREFPLHVILTGPARGYVKNGLESAQIPYTHYYLQTPQALVNLYQTLDFYLITSREEGGPKGLMESMASGIPVVSTAVGMAPDLILNGVNGYMVKNEDVEGLTASAVKLMSLSDTAREKMNLIARKHVSECDVNNVAMQHWRKVYQPLLGEIS